MFWQLLDRCFASAGRTAVMAALQIDKGLGSTPTKIPGAGGIAVGAVAPDQVGGDAGIEAAIRAAQHVDEPGHSYIDWENRILTNLNRQTNGEQSGKLAAMAITWKDSIQQQREALADELHEPLQRLADACAQVWGDREQLDRVLTRHFAQVPHCTFLYVMDPKGKQLCDNVSRGGLLPEHFGRDRSQRPYMLEPIPESGFLLSDAYISEMAHRPSLTAIQRIYQHGRDGELLGLLGADFDLRNLPMTAELYEESRQWRQIKGDPAIRGTVFQQQRTESLFDRNMEQAMSILEELIMDRGLFQAVLHFSSSRATIWLVDDPYRYRILDHEALNDPDICLAYPARAYPKDALIPVDRTGALLQRMRDLRMADETLYLRSASINIFNGMISLTFSCDGSHYMSWDEFLDKDMSFWFGSAA